MTEPPPDDRPIPLPPLPQPPPVKPTSRLWLLLLALPLLLAGGVAAWWFGSAPTEPPLPADISDPEVLEAVTRARQDVLRRPRDAASWGNYGMTLLGQLFADEADRCFAEAHRLNPRDAQWLYGRAVIALKRTPDQAVPLLRQAAAATSSLAHADAARVQLAEALLERQQLDEADAVFRQVPLDDPNSAARVALGLGLVARARGDYQRGEDLLTTARQSRYATKTATGQLATLARLRGDAALAATLDREMASLPDDPPWPDPLLDEAVRLQVGRRGRERYAKVLERQQRYAEAAEVYLDQIRVKPTSEACVEAGVNLAQVQEFDRALPLLRQAIQLDPDNPHAHYTLALVQFTRAEKEWAHSPGSKAAEDWFGEAIEHAKRTTELKPGHARAYQVWGLALKHLGRPAEAVEPLRKGVGCSPDLFRLQLGLGEALLEAGRPGDAEVYLENARRLDPDDPRPTKALERVRKRPK